MSITAMKQALEVLEDLASDPPGVRALHPHAVVITALRAAIEQAEKAEPVGEVRDMKYGAVRFYGKPTERKYLPDGTKLYTLPPQPPEGWQLPAERKKEVYFSSYQEGFTDGWNAFREEVLLAAAPKPGDNHD